MKSALGIVISREYLERVKRKSFIITTLLTPLFMALLMIAPALIMVFSSPESKNIAIIDETGLIAAHLRGNDDIRFIVTTAEPLDSARVNDSYDGVLVIGADAVANPNDAVRMYSHGSLSMATDGFINSQVEKAIEDARLQNYQIENLRQILNEVSVDLHIPVVDIDKEEDSEISSIVSYFISLAADMVLYMFILIYGQMVMTSIIDEKANRVLELVVSSVKPTDLMLGKIVGVGLVAITQIVIWVGLLGACSAWLLPLLSGKAAAGADPEMETMLAQLTDSGTIMSYMGYMLAFFIAGYLFYSSIFAAIGSAVDNVQDASQLTTIPTMPIVLAIVGSIAIINNPQSGMAFWLSIIPFTSPMCMMARIPFEVPLWQILLSLGLLVVSVLLMVWLCAKIYRVGIFMYGKKPRLVDLIRWARYK